MKNRVSRYLCLLFLLCVGGFLAPQAVNGQQQPVSVTATELYRFRISNTNLGYLLTGDYQQGVNHGYIYETTLGGIYVPPSGYTPVAGSGLVPLYQWTVVYQGRPYTYLSTFYTPQPSNYHFDGIIGYAIRRDRLRGCQVPLH